MQKFIVEVPTYIGLTVHANDAATAAEVGQRYVENNLSGEMLVRWPMEGGHVVETQNIQLLDETEDRTPDVFLEDCTPVTV